MKLTRFQTTQVPASGPGAVPVALAIAGEVPMRVAVRNIGAVLLFIGSGSTDVTEAGAETFRLPPGGQEVFVLAPGQKLYASGAGAGGFVSASSSEALPLSGAFV
jgi:hypothetical protein